MPNVLLLLLFTLFSKLYSSSKRFGSLGGAFFIKLISLIWVYKSNLFFSLLFIFLLLLFLYFRFLEIFSLFTGIVALLISILFLFWYSLLFTKLVSSLVFKFKLYICLLIISILFDLYFLLSFCNSIIRLNKLLRLKIFFSEFERNNLIISILPIGLKLLLILISSESLALIEQKVESSDIFPI